MLNGHLSLCHGIVNSHDADCVLNGCLTGHVVTIANSHEIYFVSNEHLLLRLKYSE